MNEIELDVVLSNDAIDLDISFDVIPNPTVDIYYGGDDFVP